MRRVGRSGPPASPAAMWSRAWSTGCEALAPYYAGYLPQMYAVADRSGRGAAVRCCRPNPGRRWCCWDARRCFPLFMVLVGRAAAAASQRRWLRLRRLGARFMDALSGLTTLRLYGAAQREQRMLAASRRGLPPGDHGRAADRLSLRAGAGVFRHGEHCGDRRADRFSPAAPARWRSSPACSCCCWRRNSSSAARARHPAASAHGSHGCRRGRAGAAGWRRPVDASAVPRTATRQPHARMRRDIRLAVASASATTASATCWSGLELARRRRHPPDPGRRKRQRQEHAAAIC